jgi:putative transposase
MLEYKMADHGGILVKVPKTFPSSQLCNCCGKKNPKVRDLSIRKWRCPECGCLHDRDINAAINILKKGMEVLAA